MLKKYQLDNGMNVILAQSKKSPVVSTQVWVRTGSADELKGEEGISHFIEHLLFKGTEKYGVGEIAQRVEGAGGQLNAYTSFDQTVYYMTLSKEYVNEALDMLSEMVGFPTFDKVEIDNEREVVCEEIKRGMDNPSRVASRAMFELCFKKHPYKRPVIGFEKVVRKVSVNKIKQYHSERYSPKNMTLIISGDFETSSIKKEVKKCFERIEVRKLAKRPREKEELQLKARIKIDETKFNTLSTYISWPIPKVKNKDIPALDLLSMLLGSGDSSRLTKKIRNELGLVNYIVSSTYTPQDPGLFVIGSAMKEENYSDCMDALLNELKAVFEKGFSAEEVQKAITNLESHEYFSMETVDGIAGKYGHYEFLMNDPEYFNEYMKNIKEQNPETLWKIAKKYLKPETINISVQAKEVNEVKKVATSWSKSFSKLYKEIPKKLEHEVFKGKKKKNVKLSSKNKEPELIEIAPRVSLIFKESHETGTVSLQCAMQGGLLYENHNKLGISNLMADCWLGGTEQFSEEELSIYLESRALYMGSFSGKNTVGLKLNTIASNFDDGINIFLQCLDKPRFPQEVIDREKKQIIHNLNLREDHPAQIAFLGLTERLFKGHPYSWDAEGDENSLNSITREDIVNYHNKIINGAKIVFSVVGYADKDKLVDTLKKHFNKKRQDVIKMNSYEMDSLDKDLLYFYPLEKEQSHLFVAYRGLALDDERKPALRLLESILAGQGGRLFIELRDKASLAYSVSPMRMEGIDTGYFGAYIACSPEKVEKALSMMTIEFDKIVNEGINEDELSRAKQNIIGKTDIKMQRNNNQCSTMLFDQMYGLGFDQFKFNTEKINKVDVNDIQILAKEIFSTPKVISLVGPNNPIKI